MAFPNLKAIPVAILLCTAALPAQTLAKKGWANSGMTIAPWWQSPVLYQIDPLSFQNSNGDGSGDLAGIAQRLDYLQALNVDAIVLTPVQTAAPSPTQSFDSAYGAPGDLDQLISESSRHRIRIFVDLSLSSTRTVTELVNIARFWLSRGIAGLRLTLPPGDPTSPTQLSDRIRELRKLCAGYPGDRVLFWDAPNPSAQTQPSSQSRPLRHPASIIPDSAQLSLNPALELLDHLDAPTLRRALTTLPLLTPTHTTVLATDSSDHPRSFDRFSDSSHELGLARILATALLTSPGAPLLYFGQELGMQTTPAHGKPTPVQRGDALGFTAGTEETDMGRNTANAQVEDADRSSLLNWYRRLTALHHARSVLREGSVDLLNLAEPSVVAWVRRPRAAQPGAPSSVQSTASDVVVLCNLSARPAVLSLTSELHRLNINPGAGILHTLATSETPATSAADEPTNDPPVSINSIKIPPYAVYIGELHAQAGLESVPLPTRSRQSSHQR